MKNKKVLPIYIYLLGWLLFFSTLPIIAQQDIPIEIEKTSGNVYCLTGIGGNMALLETNECLLVIDSKFQDNAEKVLARITAFSAKPLKYLVDTHYHGDHTGGNEIIGKNAEIIAHQNCKTSLIKTLESQKKDTACASRIKTFDDTMELTLGDEKVKLLYLGAGHTSGDTIVVFENAKVIHPGDLFFNGLPPYIDVKDGSDTENWLRIIETLAKTYPDYKLIPGHGKVADMKSFLRFADYLRFLRDETAKAIKAGKTREQAMAETDFTAFKDLEERGFLSKKNNIGWVYDEMTRQK
ncbi:MAG: MBL fold metallo-hydrolase [Candidatus Aminicenantes bacterium]|nr:MBL fold metallo-hydrolase [Candidatus Aminicenantes bacterium]